MRKVCRTLTISLCAALLAAGTLTFADADARSISYDLNIPSEDLTAALQSFAIASHHKLLYKAELTAGKISRALKGHFTAQEAMEALLSGTGLSYEITGSSVVLIKDTPSSKTSELREDGNTPSSPRAAPQSSEAQPILLAQADQAKSTSDVPVDKPEDKSKKDKTEGLSEIVVTGTLLHNVDPITPVITITQADLQNQGYTNLTQVFEQLPQNFLDGASPASNAINGAGPNANTNYSFATGVNLRGLGPDSTLVLMNGKRLASNGNGSLVDISQVPVSAIDHIEILSDGASALYGSDAVAGVVNIVTKRSFSGVEVSGRGDAISDGKTPNYGGSLLSGFAWASGSAVLGIDYEKDNPLLASKRTWTALLPEPYDLTPEMQSTRIYVSLQNAFTDNLSLTTDFLGAHRTDSDHALFAGGALFETQAFVNQYTLSGQLDYKLPRSWVISLIGTGSRERDAEYGGAPSVDSFAGSRPLGDQIASIEMRADGPLFQLPGGAGRIAVGGSFRRETYLETDYQCAGAGCNSLPNSGTPWMLIQAPTESSRHVSSAYSELLIPIIGEGNAVKFTRQLRLSISGRFDDYSDFGHTANPRIAMDWVPIAGLRVHGSWSRSFQAPTLRESSTNIYYAATENVPDPSAPGGSVLGLLLDGTNPALQPETAKTFNFGVSYEPMFLSGVKFDASYFSIDFSNQIERLTDIPNIGFFSWLQQAAVLGPLVTVNPTPAQVAQALAGRLQVYNGLAGDCLVGTTGCPPIDPSAVKAIGNVGFVNASTTTIRGFDLTSNYTGDVTRYGRFKANVSGTFYTTYQQQISPEASEYSLLNTYSNPLRFRVKTNLGWEEGPFTLNARLNYSPSYDNPNCDNVDPCKIATWATVDLSSVVRLESAGFRASFSVMNVFNRAPPFTGATYNTNGILPYDPLNGNPMGRAFSVTFSKRWGPANQP